MTRTRNFRAVQNVGTIYNLYEYTGYIEKFANFDQRETFLGWSGHEEYPEVHCQSREGGNIQVNMYM